MERSDLNRFMHSGGQYLNIQDARIYIEETGHPEGEPLMMLHGGLGSMADLNPMVEGIPDSYRIIGMDFRGHGRSTLGSAPLSYAMYQSDVRAVMMHLGIASAIVVGMSDGGIVGYRIAAETPEAVRGLITIGAQWRMTQDDPSLSMLAGMTPDMWQEMFPESVEYYRQINPTPDFDRLVGRVVAVWTDMGEAGYPGEKVNQIQTPVLIVRGGDDPLFSLNEAVALTKQTDTAEFLNIPFAGHEAHKDSPDILFPGMKRFLTSLQ